MDIIKHLTEQSADLHMTTRYNTFIGARLTRTLPDDVYVEKHHILPRSHYPELGREPSNLIKLTAREHYLAHWMLAKILGGKQWFAFNNMKRLAKRGHFTHSSLYERSRKYLAEQISEMNKGREMSIMNRANMSEIHRDKITVRCPDGTLKRVTLDDPKLLSGEYVHQRVGSAHRESTKQLMREAHTRRPPMHMCITESGDTIRVYSHEGCPIGTTPGVSESYREMKRRGVSNTKWYFDPVTGKDRRVKLGENTEGLIPGRRGGLGFSHINAGRKKRADC